VAFQELLQMIDLLVNTLTEQLQAKLVGTTNRANKLDHFKIL
jgi:hypothetical protein